MSERLEELVGDGTPEEVELVVSIATSFLQRVPGLVAGLDEALTAQDDDAGHRAAHSLKGAAANLGAVELARICQVIEDLAEEGRHAEALAEREALALAVEDACLEIGRYVSMM